jgi:integrase
MADPNQPITPLATPARDKDGLHKRRGIWHYKLKIGGKWKEVSTKTRIYKDAQKVRREALQAQDEGRLPTDFGKLVFEKACEQWLEERKALVAPKTHRIDRERSVALRAFFGGKRLVDITSAELRGFQVRRTQKVSPRTVNLETKVLRMILKGAKLWSRISDDFKALREDKRGPGRALTQEQETKLFEVAASKPQWETVFCVALIAANTSARGVEIKGLCLRDVDLLKRTLTIRRASTKTDAGARVVPLNAEAHWACARLLGRAQNLGAKEPAHYLLPAAMYQHKKAHDPLKGQGGYDPTRQMQSWRTAWRKLTIAASLPGLRFHDLRHHCITKLAEAGVAEQTLMAIAGHVSREMLEHYSHVRMNARRDAVSAIEGSSRRAIPVAQAEVVEGPVS